MRRWIWPLLILAAAMAPVAAPAEAPPERIVAIGDLHGDHDAWLAIARGAGIVDTKGHWSGGQTVLVQLGDIVDRAPDSLEIIRDLMRLQREAPRRGGRVVVLIGNHEAMNMTGDLRYVHPGEYAAFVTRDSEQLRTQVYEANRKTFEDMYRAKQPSLTPAAIRELWMKATPPGMIEHQKAWGPDGELGRWTLGHPAVAKIGDSLFVHGGISAEYSTMPIDEINRRVREALEKPSNTPMTIADDPMGPLWYRGLITRSGDEEPPKPPATLIRPPSRPGIEQEIDLDLRAYGVKRIVVAHTPSLTGIISNWDGKLWRVDSGNSRAYGGVPSYLEIIGDRVTAHQVQRPTGKVRQ